MSNSSGSGSPPYYTSPLGAVTPDRRRKTSPPQEITDDQGWGTVRLRYSPRIEAGGTSRFEIFTSHVKDGGFDPTSLTFKILDGYDQSVSTVTIPTPQKNNSGVGDWYTDIVFPATLKVGYYTVLVTGSYVAKDGNTIKINFRQEFELKRTKRGKSDFTFVRTDQA